jgi:intracellular multiplication protein IcmL
MTEDALTVIRSRNDFYRHNYRRLVLALMLSITTITLLVGTLVYLLTHPPAPRYIATTEDGRIIPLIPLTEPNLSDSTVLEWARKVAVETYDYNFANYREAIQKLSAYFTKTGWPTFVKALNDSNNLEAIEKKQLIVHATSVGPPVIVVQGLMSKRYTWKIQVPLLIYYRGAGTSVTLQKVVVNLLVVRISTLQSVKGVGVEQFIVEGSGSIRG